MKKAVTIFLLISCMILTGCSVKEVEKLKDNELFANEYGIDKDNPFTYSKYDDIMKIFESGKGVILLANSDDEASLKAVEIIYKQLRNEKIEEIYYYNPKTLKEKEPKKYKKLKSIIEESTTDYKLVLPTLFAVEDGKIINYSSSFSKKEQLSEEYLTKKRIKSIQSKYSDIINYRKSE